MDPERQRLAQDAPGHAPWRRWGPYLSERQWGTVREDYSPDGSAWSYFPHDHARSRAYRWGEDGLAGFCDDQQLLCLSVALWNGKDPILKERLFGLTGPEGNHAEDVKELYYYVDALPTAAYLKMRYKYPQAAFPYSWLVEENRRRGRSESEFELIDTGVFAEQRYFDVTVEYAKASADDVLMRITVDNCGPDTASLVVLPQVWFRNTWSWRDGAVKPKIVTCDPGIRVTDAATAAVLRSCDSAGHLPDHSVSRAGASLAVEHPVLGQWYVYSDGSPEVLLTENETNVERLFGGTNAGPTKDAFHRHLIDGDINAVSRTGQGTKAALAHRAEVPAGGRAVFRLRLRATPTTDALAGFDHVFADRLAEADAFYAPLQVGLSEDARLVQRQAWAGMIWSKQVYLLDVREWLSGDPSQPPPPDARRNGRNQEWGHLNNADVVSMPDKWEYPWYAAWDLAFHCVPLAQVDAAFAKQQLVLLTREWYMHPNGQLPAYEWAFGDVNPPVHAWATWQVYRIDEAQSGRGDRAFLERVFHKLLLNFTWWVNRKDAHGRNIFQGGFLGLDNIGVFDRSAPLPTGGHIDQADGTSWMAMYSLNMMRIALELARDNAVYQDTATKFFEHFLHIAEAMNGMGEAGHGLWCEQDRFYYDALRLPGGAAHKLRVRSMVGLIPLFAVEVLDHDLLETVPEFARRLEWFLSYRPDLASLVSRWAVPGRSDTRLLSLLRGHRMKCLLQRMLDPQEFLSDFGIRALSRHHLDQPYALDVAGQRHEVRYVPAESDTGLFGGNSNWRGPIWMPVNYMLVESLRKFHDYYGDDFRVQCPTGSGEYRSLLQVADELTRRLAGLVLRGDDGRRPVFGDQHQLQTDPRFRDLVPFYEYFHGDNGRGVGASHQTGWTGLLATLLSTPAGVPGAMGCIDCAKPSHQS